MFLNLDDRNDALDEFPSMDLQQSNHADTEDFLTVNDIKLSTDFSSNLKNIFKPNDSSLERLLKTPNDLLLIQEEPTA
jgi:hypothetical protein